MLFKKSYYKKSMIFLGRFESLWYAIEKKISEVKKKSYRITPSSAIYPKLELDKCISCQICVNICPSESLDVKGVDGKIPQVFMLDLATCTSCSLCWENCPTKALKGSLHKLNPAYFEETVPKIDLVNY